MTLLDWLTLMAWEFLASVFDRHRRGGECVDPATIKGIHRNPAGVWRYDGGENRAAAHRGTPQTAETAPARGTAYPDDPEGAQRREDT